MQAAAAEPAPIGLILDGEMRGEPSELVTLALVYGLTAQEKPEAELEAISLSGSGLEGAAFVEAVGRFYARIILRDFPERFRRYRGLPIGLDDTRPSPEAAAGLQAVLAKTGDDGAAVAERANTAARILGIDELQ